MKDCDGELFDEYNRDEFIKQVIEEYNKNKKNKSNEADTGAKKE